MAKKNKSNKDVSGSTPEVASTVVGPLPTLEQATELPSGERGAGPADDGQPEEQPIFDGAEDAAFRRAYGRAPTDADIGVPIPNWAFQAEEQPITTRYSDSLPRVDESEVIGAEELPEPLHVFSDSSENFVRGIVGICEIQRDKVKSGKQWRQMKMAIIAGLNAIRE